MTPWETEYVSLFAKLSGQNKTTNLNQMPIETKMRAKLQSGETS